MSDQACVKMFEPKTTCNQECLITTFQEVYFVSESFEEAKEKMRWTANKTHTEHNSCFSV